MIRLYRQSLGLGELLREQQEVGQMTDVRLVCAGGETLAAHRLVLATHPLWAGVVIRTRMSHKEEEMLLIMENFTSLEVRAWLDEAYRNIVDLRNSKSEKPYHTNEANSVTLIDVAPDIKNFSFDECHELKSSFDCKEEVEVGDSEEEIDSTEEVAPDDLLVNMSEFFNLESLVTEQIIVNIEEKADPNQIFKYSEESKKLVNDACMNKLKELYQDHPSKKVYGLPLYDLVYSDNKLLNRINGGIKKKFKGDRKVWKCHFSSSDGNCQFYDESKKVLFSHITESHCDQGPFMCKGCGRRFAVKDRAYTHIHRNHIRVQINEIIRERFNSKLSCHFCKADFKNNKALRAHIRHVHAKLSEPTKKCTICGFVAVDYCALRRHKREEHGTGIRPCEVCGTILQSSAGYYHHLENFHGNKKYTCEHCGEVFNTKNYLNIHVVKKHTEKSFSCEECGALFHSQSQVKRHQESHSDVRPFPCSQCEKKFKTERTLVEHMNTHIGARPYQCDKCSSAFTQRGALNKHKRVVHNGIKSFVCNFCNFRGGQKIDLKRHLKNVHNIELSSLLPLPQPPASQNNLVNMKDKIYI